MNPKNPEITNYIKSNNLISFTLENVYIAFANAIRRISFSEIPTVMCNPLPYHDSDIKVIENKTIMHNEFLQDRIGLLPINLPYSEVDKYSFELNVKNDQNVDLQITSNDITIIENDSKKKYNNEELNIFNKNYITGDYPIICNLNKKKKEFIEELVIEFKPTINIGNEHARFSSVCLSKYIYSPVKNINDIKNNYIIQHKDLNKKDAGKKFDIYEKEKYFVKDNYDNPISFDFEIESIGILQPEIILYRSLIILKHKINNLQNNIKRITRSNTAMNGFDIHIENEDHTIGNLLETYLYQFYKVRNHDSDYHINFVSYKIPHPLEKLLILRINFTKENNEELLTTLINDLLITELNNIIDSTIEKILEITQLKDDFDEKNIV